MNEACEQTSISRTFSRELCQLLFLHLSSKGPEYKLASWSVHTSTPHNDTPPLLTRKCSKTAHPVYQEYRAAGLKAQSHQG